MPQKEGATMFIVDGAYNIPIEKVVSKYLKKQFQIQAISKIEEGCMHDIALVRGNEVNVFVKVGGNSFSLDQFKQEAIGLKYIETHSAVKTPEVIDVVEFEDKALLILEAIDVKPMADNKAWEILGRGLATLHQSTSEKCGFDTHNYLGIFHQDNSPTETWVEFFGERRLGDSMKMAVNSGNMKPEHCNAVEKLIQKLPEICGPIQPHSLLHGDPWPGNLLFDGKQMVAIDCSIYYGNREIDLSTVDFFYPVSEHFFKAYHEVYPIDPGYSERKELWQINQLLGHVTLFGESHIPKLMNAVNKYI